MVGFLLQIQLALTTALLLLLQSPLTVHSLAASKKYRPLRLRGSNPLDIEKGLQPKWVLGSDDSGTGALAGPIVTVSCCLLDLTAALTKLPVITSDGKGTSKADRQALYEAVCSHPEVVVWTYATRTSQEIDAAASASKTGGMRPALMSCFQESIEGVVSKLLAHKLPLGSGMCERSNMYSIVDGHKSPPVSITSRPWKKGDETVYSVALASILAREVRDAWVQEATTLYPEYNFGAHGGYASQAHLLALHQHGPSPVHRQCCKPVKGARQFDRRDVIGSAVLAAATTVLGTSLEPAAAMTRDPKTGSVLPDKGEIEAAIPNDWKDVDNPFVDGAVFNRLDSSQDSLFYQDPRFVEHVDDQAVRLMTSYISKTAIQADTESLLDLCSSWTSHIQLDSSKKLTRVAGLGMNEMELQANAVLTEAIVQDLNEKTILPYADESFDVVLCQLSIDYLTHPLEVCREIGRVLKSGGKVHILFSNRLFLSKAVAIWTGADDVDHAYTVGAYLKYCGAPLLDISARDLSVRKGRDQRIVGDPLYVVTAMKG